MLKRIHKAAVLGAGTMGARIAAHHPGVALEELQAFGHGLIGAEDREKDLGVFQVAGDLSAGKRDHARGRVAQLV